MNLILETKTKSDEIIKAYLEENASQALANKINNGVMVEKDGKRLLNKKSLSSFNKYANEEARKIAEKGANGIYVDDDTVFGWAIHYFEEDSIIGKLYNEDGSEYHKPVSESKTTQKPTYTPTSVKKTEPQISLFDMMNSSEPTDKTPVDNEKIEDVEVDETPTEEEINEAFETENAPEVKPDIKPAEQKGTPFYEKYKEMALKYSDCIVCYKIGDFYEVLGKNAAKVAEELELTLTGRDCGLTERVPMVGFPYHAADMYFSKLVGKGYKLAVVESAETQFKLKKEPDEPMIDAETGEIATEQNDDEVLNNYHKGALLSLLELFDEDATIG